MQNEIIPVLPFWALVSFGAYLLFNLGLGIVTFNDKKEAYEELMKVCSFFSVCFLSWGWAQRETLLGKYIRERDSRVNVRLANRRGKARPASEGCDYRLEVV